MNEHAVITPLSAPVARYILHPAIARGQAATIHPAHVVGQGGFARLVAAKRIHATFVGGDPGVVAGIENEARVASTIHHPNFVPVLDVVHAEGEVVIVQELVHGVPLRLLLQRSTRVDLDVAIAILAGIVSGLVAIHEAKLRLDTPRAALVDPVAAALDVLVSVDGVPRLLDFGIARSRRADLYAVGLLGWKLLDSNRRLEPFVTRALANDPRERFASASEMLEALLAAGRPAPPSEVARWVRELGADHLEKRRITLAACKASFRVMQRIVPRPISSAVAEGPPLATSMTRLLPWVATGLSLLVFGIVAGMVVQVSFGAR
jgi:eukaryotic-like serine/threonine-protein kinase